MNSVKLKTNPNEFEGTLEIVVGVLCKQVEGFIAQMEAMAATDEARAAIKDFSIRFAVGRLMTLDACVDLANTLHSRWGEAAFDAHKGDERIEELTNAFNYRARAHSPSNPKIRSRVKELTGGACAYCAASLGEDFHIEHVVSKSAGGPDHFANYVPACKRCNTKKATLHVLDFIKRRGTP